MIITRVDSNLIKQSIKLGLSVLITCAVAQHFDRISFVFYPLLAVILIVDDQDENSFQAARGRILGTVSGGFVVFLVHTILSGWIGIFVSLLITVPLLRRLGWGSGLTTAVVITVIFLSIPGYTNLNWYYILNRSIDTLVGVVIAIAIGRLLWPKNRLMRMEELHQKLLNLLSTRMQQHSQSLLGFKSSPPPLQPGSITKDLLEIQRLVNIEAQLGSKHIKQLTRLRWQQRMSLWRSLHTHWILMERLLNTLAVKYQHLQLPELAHQLDISNDIGWKRLHIESNSPLSLSQRILLEEEGTRFLRLIRSQKKLDFAVKKNSFE